ncbi:hypothetical protein Acr_15g0005870 [Actinidia rufa]|uniref:EGF-like domain-containing protein n=1 Tax=Actinidia rufa TaxID=165716 RepID=A0A7J0FVL6_9ERIC|nr:hypothetical protein Acr_15g0005870 [Actinidia rufa]
MDGVRRPSEMKSGRQKYSQTREKERRGRRNQGDGQIRDHLPPPNRPYRCIFKAASPMASPAISNLLLLFLLPFLPVFAASNITLSSSLSATGGDDSWISPSGEFAFGFCQIKNTNTLLLAICGRTIWKAQPTTTVSYGAMLDTGNFVLSGCLKPTTRKEGSSSISQMEEILSLIRSPGQAKSSTDLITRVQQLTLMLLNPGFSWFSVNLADINIVKGNGATVPLSWQSITPNSNHYHRATLDSDGVFRQYTCSKTSIGDQSWSVVRYIPNNICRALTNEIGSGVCGFNSYCVANSGNPDCQCPPGYSFFDPNDKFGGCKPNFPQGCGVDDGTRNPNELYDLEKIDGLNFPLGDYDSLGPYNQTQCEQSCIA